MQFLDGVGAGLQSVAVPSLVARILNGTGRINTRQGAVMTAQGIGASLSPAVGGWLAQELGYSTAFLILGSVAIGSVLLWLLFTTTIKQASAISGDEPTLDANAEHSCVAACADNGCRFPSHFDLDNHCAGSVRRHPAPVQSARGDLGGDVSGALLLLNLISDRALDPGRPHQCIAYRLREYVF